MFNHMIIYCFKNVNKKRGKFFKTQKNLRAANAARTHIIKFEFYQPFTAAAMPPSPASVPPIAVSHAPI